MNQIHTNNYIYGKKVGLINQAPTQYEPNPKKQLYIRQKGGLDKSSPYTIPSPYNNMKQFYIINKVGLMNQTPTEYELYAI